MKNLNWLKNRLEWLVKINNMDSSSFSATKREAYSDALDLVNQLDESEVSLQVSPVIPQFVAEFLDGKEDYALYELFDDEWLYSEHDQIAKWLYDNDEKTNRERELSLVLAQRYGYEVEEEQMYYVLGKHDTPILFKDHRDQIIEASNLSDVYPEADSEDFEFTEQEIKDYDPRYMTFAKPVEELEE